LSTRSRSSELRIAPHAVRRHESPRTPKLYDRSNEAISLDEIERIPI
jgi:hypothetical protein